MKMRLVETMALCTGKRRNTRLSAILLVLLLTLTEGIAQKAAQPPNTTAAQPAAPTVEKPAVIKNITTTRDAGDLVVMVSIDRPTAHQEFSLNNPSRLVVDFPNTEIKVPFLNLPVNDARVKQLRLRQFQSFNPKIARLVFDLEEDSGKHDTSDTEGAVRIVFHEGPTSATADNSPVTNGVAAGESLKQSTRPIGRAAAIPAPVTTKPLEQTAAKPAEQATGPTKVAERAAAKSTERSEVASTEQEIESQPTKPQTGVGSGKQAPKSEPAPETKQELPVIRDLARAEIPISSMAADPARDAKPASSAEPEPPKPSTPVEPPKLSPAPPPPEPVAPSSGRFEGQPLTLDLVDIPLVDFFRLMSEEGGINVVLDPEVKGSLSIKVVKVPWDQIFEAALTNNGLEKRVEGNLVRIALKKTLQEEAKQEEQLKKANLLAADLETRVKRLNYAKAESFIPALTEQKTARGTVVVDERTNSLILTDLSSSIDKMAALIDTLDTPQPQVEIEARIVSATRDFARDIGVQFGFVQGNLQRVTVGGPNTFGTIGGTRPSSTPTTTYAAGNASTGRGATEGTSTQSAGVSTGLSSNNAGNWNVNLPAQMAFGGLGISVGNIFDTFLLDAAITAGENRGLAKLISQPKVVAQNNSAAVITQGLRFPVQVIANNTVTVQFMNAALTLTVTPQITYEGNLVLDLKVENNTPDFSKTVNGIPSIQISESATRVLVSDGGTTVIGGILIDNETTEEDRVPGLASLPMVGYLFRRQQTSHSTQEVLFFITPKIVK